MRTLPEPVLIDAAPGLRLACADWLDAPRLLEPESVDLLYADPPFNTGRARSGASGRYEDRWPSGAAHAEWLRERLEASIPLLRPSGAVLLHLDHRASHRARVVLDDLLGEDCFINHIVWAYGLGGSSPRRFARKHDDILYYARTPDGHYFDPPLVPSTSRRMAGRPKKATDVLDIPSINNMSSERTGYPSQKPLALLSLLIRACCPAGGVVLDPTCGSGTTPLAALQTGRAAVAIDASPEAIALTQRRCTRPGA